MKTGESGDRYLVEAVVRASELLGAFHRPEEVLRLKDLVARTGLSNATAFRILFTLERCGLVERIGNRQYRSNMQPLRRTRYRIGYSHQGIDSMFVQEWSDSIVVAAAAENLDLIVLDNGHDRETALRNAELLVRERVDLVIDYTVDAKTAATTAARFVEAKIPLIAIGAPRPGAIYYGPNNYVAGLIGGRCLGNWARQQWKGSADQLVLLEVSASGPVVQLRTKGIQVGVLEALPEFSQNRIVVLRVNGRFAHALETLRSHIRRTRVRRIMVGAHFDASALGALVALQEAGRSEDSAVVTLGGCIEGRMELRRPGTRLVGDVTFFLDKYGEHIIRIATGVLEKGFLTKAVFTRHQLLTPNNVDHYYPNDSLITPGDAP